MQGLRINSKCFSIKPVIVETIFHMHQLAAQKDILIQVFANDSVEVYADLEMVQLVIRNLVSNAIKFSFESHAVHVEVSERTISNEDYAIIAITDFGVGIDPEVLPDLLSRNGYTTQGTAQEKGTGLGLSLCRECVERNGGNIWIESQSGVSTTFSFSVPLSKVKQPAEMAYS